jgi:hypothetical protein
LIHPLSQFSCAFNTLKLEAILNENFHHVLLDKTIEIHLIVPLKDQQTTEKAIIMYMLKYNMPLSDILEKAPKILSQVLRKRRENAIKDDEELKH